MAVDPQVRFIGFTDEDGNAIRPWWLCPNDPSCPHGAALHDIEDLDDTSPRCCFQGCTCGRPPVPSTKESADQWSNSKSTN